MQKLKQFFYCCNRQHKQDELSITMKKRAINKSYQSQARKTYIKRSIGKDPILDLSFKKNTVSTIITLGGSHNKHLHQKDKDRTINTQRQVSLSFDNSIEKISNNIEYFRYSPLPQENIHPSIDYGQSRFQEQDKQPCIYQPQQVDKLINLKQSVHINTFFTRKNKFGKDFIKKNNKKQKKYQTILNYYRKDGLDTIQQRSSIPSIDEYNEHRHISSKGTLKLNHEHQKNYNNPNNRSVQFCKSSTLGANHPLCIFQRINSQNLQQNVSQNPQELQKVILYKLQTDIRLLKRQLQNLQHEQEGLNHKKIFIKTKETEQISYFSKLQQSLSSNIMDRERQIQQIKTLLSLKSQNRS